MQSKVSVRLFQTKLMVVNIFWKWFCKDLNEKWEAIFRFDEANHNYYEALRILMKFLDSVLVELKQKPIWIYFFRGMFYEIKCDISWFN